MPCIKKMVQESESAPKPTFIHGHLVPSECWPERLQNLSAFPCLFRSMTGTVSSVNGLGMNLYPHVVQMLRDSFRAAQHFGSSLFVLDRSFLTVPLLKEWKACSEKAPGLFHAITRAKRNVQLMKDQERIKAVAVVLSMGQLSIQGISLYPMLPFFRRKEIPKLDL